MKNILLLSLLLLKLIVSAQNNELQSKITPHPPLFSEHDTVPRLMNEGKCIQQNPPAYFINGKFVENLNPNGINLKKIDEIRVVKETFENNGNQFYGQIHIRLFSNYKPNLISLETLRKKYIKQDTVPILFELNGKVVLQDYHKCIVDEKYIMSIEPEHIRKEDLNFLLVHLLTRTEANLDTKNQIQIRGNNILKTE